MLGVLVVVGIVLLLCWVAGSPSSRDIAKQQARLVPNASCPTCRSTAVERVSLGTRAASGMLGGLIFSKKARAQFHCRSCNYYW